MDKTLAIFAPLREKKFLKKNQKGVDFLNFLSQYPITEVEELFMLMIVIESSTDAAPGIKQGGFWRDDPLPVERR